MLWKVTVIGVCLIPVFRTTFKRNAHHLCLGNRKAQCSCACLWGRYSVSELLLQSCSSSQCVETKLQSKVFFLAA